MSTALLQKYCVLDDSSRKLLRETSADLEDSEKIRLKDIQKILNYRDLDQSNSKMLVVK